MSAFVEDPTAVARIALVAKREVSDWTDAENLQAQPRYDRITLMIGPVVWGGAHLRSSAAPDADAYDETDDWDDDGELDAGAPPGWPPWFQFRADPLSLRLVHLPARLAGRLDTRSTGADCAGEELSGGPLDKPGTLCARDVRRRPADFTDPESQRVLEATAHTLARELGRQGGPRVFRGDDTRTVPR